MFEKAAFLRAVGPWALLTFEVSAQVAAKHFWLNFKTKYNNFGEQVLNVGPSEP